MTVFASVVVGQAPGFGQVLAVIVMALGILTAVSSRVELKEGMAKRFVLASLCALVAVVLVSQVLHAAPAPKPTPKPTPKPDVVIIECKGGPLTWWDWIFWSC